MFRFSLKKEEKEIIVRTINEIQELRAELSLLKNTLAGMAQGSRDPDAAGTPEGGGEPAGAACGGDLPEGADSCPGELHENGLVAEGAVSYREEAGPPAPESPGAAEGLTEGANPGRDAVPEEGTAPGRAGENTGKENAAVPEAPGGSAPMTGAVAGRDWAVVRLTERKKPWWKIWEPDKRETRRSI